MFSDSFSGIAPSSVPGFVVAEFVGAGLGVALHRALGAATTGVPLPSSLQAPAPAITDSVDVVHHHHPLP
jgi:hypothetical protein